MDRQRTESRRIRTAPVFSLAAVLAVATMLTGAALAHNAAAPQSNSAPSIHGQPRQGRTVTADNGSWSNSPASFAYQWQQCDSSGAGCNAISGATSKSYLVASGDVDKSLRVQVTATNSDGSTNATSAPTNVVSSNSGPVNTAAPTVSGTAKVGEQLEASSGTWTGGVGSYSYQWQRCDQNGASCVAVTDATAKAYGVRSVDAGNTLRVVVTATNLSGSTNATSGATALVAGGRHSSDRPQPRADAPLLLAAEARKPRVRAVYALRRLVEGGHGDRARRDGRQARLHPSVLDRPGSVWDACPKLDADPALPPRGPLHLDAAGRRQVRRLEPDRQPLDPRLRGLTPKLSARRFGVLAPSRRAAFRRAYLAGLSAQPSSISQVKLFLPPVSRSWLASSAFFFLAANSVS